MKIVKMIDIEDYLVNLHLFLKLNLACDRLFNDFRIYIS